MLAETVLNEKPDSENEVIARAISGATAFRAIQAIVVSTLAGASSLRTYPAGETIFAMGQFDGSEFLIVAKGKVKVARADGAGGMFFDYLREGDTYGLPAAVLEDSQRGIAAATLSAESDCEILAVDGDTLRQTIEKRPSLAKSLLLHFAFLLAGGESVAEESSSERRVCAALLALVERDAVSAEWRIPKMPKHRELAEKSGVDEVEAANAVASLIQSGIARRLYPGLVIDDIGQLNRLAR